MRCPARRTRQMRQAPPEVVSLGGPVERETREERRGRGRALLALRCHRWGLRPTGFEMAAVLRVYPEPVGERRVGRSVPHPLGLTAAAGSAPARSPSMRPRPWSVGIRSAAVAVWRAPHLQYSAHSARMSRALSCLTLGSTARRRSESTAHWEILGRWAFREARHARYCRSCRWRRPFGGWNRYRRGGRFVCVVSTRAGGRLNFAADPLRLRVDQRPGCRCMRRHRPSGMGPRVGPQHRSCGGRARAG